jgi:uncharacterized protein with von Willebrand factor type A (vWA) domain
MIAGIGRFVEALREEGLQASPAELLDAVRAVEQVGVEDRARFRAALRATLAKGRRPAAIFDRVFDRWYVPPALGGAEGKRKRTGGGDAIKPSPARGSVRAEPRQSRPRREEPSERARGRGEPGDEVQELRRVLRSASEGRRPATGRLRAARLDTDDAAHRGGARSSPDPDPLRRDLTLRMTSEDERRIAREVPRLIEQLRLRRGRRQRRARRGTLWPRRAWRENLSRGGVPFVLPYRRPKPRRTRIVLLVDVSWSVARSAGLFLWMASEFLRFGRNARVLLFVDRPVDATDALRRWTGRSAPAGRGGEAGRGSRRPGPGDGIRPGTESFAELLQSVPDLDPGGRSDYGRALHALRSGKLLPGGRDTVLLVLGDARTNRFDPLPWALEEIAARTRAILWLVPEHRGRWGTGDSALGRYLPFIDTVVEARNLAGLARGVGELVRRL